jgi:hypothetical protein
MLGLRFRCEGNLLWFGYNNGFRLRLRNESHRFRRGDAGRFKIGRSEQGNGGRCFRGS